MTAAASAIRAVTFDYWQTLVGERPGDMRAGHIAALRASFADRGHEVDAAALEAAFEANWRHFEDVWRANSGQHTAADAARFVGAHLGLDVDDEIVDRFVDDVRSVGETVHLELAPGIKEAIATLHGAGVGLAIVCDVGMTPAPVLRDRLESLGLLDAFDAWSFSDETGVFKPASEAFTPALAGLGVVDPSTAAHVGDNPRTDVAGALAMGMTAVRYTGLLHTRPGFVRRVADALPEGPVDASDETAIAWATAPREPEEAHLVIDDHRDLAGVLGIA